MALRGLGKDKEIGRLHERDKTMQSYARMHSFRVAELIRDLHLHSDAALWKTKTKYGRVLWEERSRVDFYWFLQPPSMNTGMYE